MNPSKYTKDLDAVLLAYSVLKRLGSGGVATFEDRIKSQKTQYFSQLFGVAPAYYFRLYIRGPYSSQLADDLYQIKRDGNLDDVGVDPFSPEDLEARFVRLAEFLSNKNIRQLEVIATFHWLLTVAKIPHVEAEQKLVELKQATPDEVVLASKATELLPKI